MQHRFRLELWDLALVVAVCLDEIFSLCDVAFHVVFPEVECLLKTAFTVGLDGIFGDF